MRNLSTLVALAALSVVAACSGETVTDSRTFANLELALVPKVDTLYVGGVLDSSGRTAKLTATATAQGSPIILPGHVFESSDNTVATVDSGGVVRAQQVGTADITVRVNETKAHATIVVLPIVRTVSVTVSASQALVGDTLTVTAAAIGWTGTPVAGQPITYTSSSPNATVSATGRVTFNAPGSATITARSGDAVGTVTLTALAREFIGGGQNTISSGLDATCGLLPLGRTYCFGRAPLIGVSRDTTCFDNNSNPRVGCTLIPLQIAGQLQFTAISVGDSVACGLNAQGRAYCWGGNKYGQIGGGISVAGTSLLPTPVTGPLNAALTFSQITAGTVHACGLISTGAAYCWGQDSTFQLGGGDNFIVNSTTPIPVAGNGSYRQIVAGRGHTCAIRSGDNAAVCWGDNSVGQLGLGAIGPALDVPMIVSSLSFVQLSARGDNTCGVVAGGSLYCWGANQSGQTGQAASLLPVVTPTRVAGGGYTAVSVGGTDFSNGTASHACALAAGTVLCWGANNFAQLGRGSIGDPSSVPTAVGTRTYNAITAGTRTSCATAADGMYCWGSAILGAAGNQIQALTVGSPQRVAPPQ
jgi:alpha-tubulin suppressor-like RCC1 family protein